LTPYADADSFGPFPNIWIIASNGECCLSPKLEFLPVSEISKPSSLQQAPNAATNCHFVKFNLDHLAHGASNYVMRRPGSDLSVLLRA
jgi:hypothetical protein